MDRLPSNIIFNIFSKVPVKCLARSRCVSKVWCNYIDDRYLVIIHDKRVVEEPTPILYHQHLSGDRKTLSLCFHVTKSKQPGTTHFVLEPKEEPFEYFHKKLSKLPRRGIRVRGSCNGMMYLSNDEGNVVTTALTTLAVVHPLRKECYELPPLPVRRMFRDSCGLGFDTSTNTLKMVCVFQKEHVPKNNLDLARKNLCTMVHVFGTNSWREIPQVPSYPIEGKTLFANGCLHWLVSDLGIKTEDGGRHVIWFDLEKEEFGLIDPPKRMGALWRNDICTDEQLVDLNGEAGYVCTKTMEFWVLKQKEWVPHCRIDKDIPHDPYDIEVMPYDIEVMGCWNKEGDILIKSTELSGDHVYCVFFVYNLKSGVFHKTNIAGMDGGSDLEIFMYPNTLASIHGINKNSFSMKKTILKKSSCQEVLSSS